MSGTQRINLLSGLFTPFADEAITITSAAKKLTVATFTRATNIFAKRAIITVATARIRYRTTGSNPTSSVGHLIGPGAVIILIGTQAIRNFRIIKAGSSNAAVFCTYEN